MRDLQDIKRFWAEHKNQPLVLCTLIGKKGSSYRAVGAKKIIAQNGMSSGLLSGGCLEAEIEKTARSKWNDAPYCKTFSTTNAEDRLFGYQAGCAGTIDVLFEHLPSDSADLDLFLPFGSTQRANGIYVSLEKVSLARRQFVSSEKECKGAHFYEAWKSPVELFIIGCGPDAKNYADLASCMGWNAHFLDYRENYVARFPVAQCLTIENIASTVMEGKNTAVILMTHNYQADLDIFAKLVGKDIAYLGCLGPGERYQQLKDELEKRYSLIVPPEWERRVHAPAGLLTKSRSPSDIALTVIAQIQIILNADQKDDRS